MPIDRHEMVTHVSFPNSDRSEPQAFFLLRMNFGFGFGFQNIAAGLVFLHVKRRCMFLQNAPQPGKNGFKPSRHDASYFSATL